MEQQKDVFVSISREAHETLVRLREKYGSNRNVVEKALQALGGLEAGGSKAAATSEAQMRLQLMGEFNTVMLDRSDFGALVEAAPSTRFDDALGRAYLKRIIGRNLSELSLSEHVELLRRCYSGAFKWLDNIYESREGGASVVVFVHQFDEPYSEFMASFFEQMFGGLGFRTVERRIRKKYFILDVRPA